MNSIMKSLIFDVETTGLLPKGKKLIPVPIHEYPHILQLSYAIYDLAQKKIIKQYDSYINIDDSVEITEKGPQAENIRII